MTTVAGVAPVLPATVSATLSDDTTKSVAVIWDAVDASKYAAVGSYSLNGTIVESTSVKATAIVTVTAASSQDGDDYIYTVTDGKAQITKYTGTGGAVTIPSILGGVPVKSIGNYAFGSCEGITSIYIPQGLTSIVDYAFAVCSGLTSIHLTQPQQQYLMMHIQFQPQLKLVDTTHLPQKNTLRNMANLRSYSLMG